MVRTIGSRFHHHSRLKWRPVLVETDGCSDTLYQLKRSEMGDYECFGDIRQ